MDAPPRGYGDTAAMNAWLLLGGAIASEVAATVSLKASDGLSRLAPVVIVVGGYVLSFWLLSLVLRELPVGTVYAIWSAVGIVGVALLGIVLFGESMSLLKAIAILVIVGGVALLQASSQAA